MRSDDAIGVASSGGRGESGHVVCDVFKILNAERESRLYTSRDSSVLSLGFACSSTSSDLSDLRVSFPWGLSSFLDQLHHSWKSGAVELLPGSVGKLALTFRNQFAEEKLDKL